MAREAHRSEGPGHEEDRPTREDVDEMPSRPDQPTPSDDATLVERDGGAHSEFVDAPPMSPGDGSPPPESGEDEDQEQD